MNQQRTVTGIVKVTPQKRISQKGTPYAQFAIEVAGKPWKVLAFGDVCDRALSSLTVNEEIEAFGKVETDATSDSPPTMFLNGFDFKDKDAKKKRALRNKQDSRITEEYVKSQEKKGIVYCSFGNKQRGWAKKKHCIKIGDKWYDKLYFIMLMLGEEKVTELLKEGQVGIFENLKHYSELKETMLGLAIIDYQLGKRPWKKTS